MQTRHARLCSTNIQQRLTLGQHALFRLVAAGGTWTKGVSDWWFRKLHQGFGRPHRQRSRKVGPVNRWGEPVKGEWMKKVDL